MPHSALHPSVYTYITTLKERKCLFGSTARAALTSMHTTLVALLSVPKWDLRGVIQSTANAQNNIQPASHHMPPPCHAAHWWWTAAQVWGAISMSSPIPVPTYNQDNVLTHLGWPFLFFLFFNFSMFSVPIMLWCISLLTGYSEIANQDYLIQSTLISIKRQKKLS